ncbi:MAG: glycosyltransferase family 2 protein [Phycisphaerales bacterium]|nr:glycosyltransferase family 2 protein [Phycisphaerales bacterium]
MTGPHPRISYIFPTRNRPDRVAQTLAAIGLLPRHRAELVIADNASDAPVRAPGSLANGIPVTVLRLGRNEGAAARNAAAEASDPASDWLVMLDDDSYPTDLGLLDALAAQASGVVAVSADIRLPRMGRRESGGLPEVFIGCGVAIRRDAFLYAGGYDPAFGYYAEEYDLAARFLLAGGRVAFDPRFKVDHHKVEAGRDMDLILGRLVRNNGWVIQRYAPDNERRELQRENRGRYRAIARKEQAIKGFGAGLVELRRTVRRQVRSPMPREVFDRFTGLSAAREAIAAAVRAEAFDDATVVCEGKNAWAVRRAMAELGVREADDAPVAMVGTMSPGPMLDAWGKVSGRRVVLPWVVAQGMVGGVHASCAA